MWRRQRRDTRNDREVEHNSIDDIGVLSVPRDTD